MYTYTKHYHTHVPQTHKNKENGIGNTGNWTYDLPMLGPNAGKQWLPLVGEIIFNLEFCPQNLSVTCQVK